MSLNKHNDKIPLFASYFSSTGNIEKELKPVMECLKLEILNVKKREVMTKKAANNKNFLQFGLLDMSSFLIFICL